MKSWNSFLEVPQTIVLLTSLLFFLTVPCSHSFHIPDPVIHFSCGAVAGGAGAVAAYPFDYIKSQMQTEYGRKKYENGLDVFVDTVQRNPLRLYKGVGVQVLGIAPEKGIKLGVNDVLATTFYSSMGSFPLWGQIVSGAIAGACQVVASSPLEVMKVGLQTSDMSFKQVWEEVGGVKGLFRGAEACILRDVLFTSICFPLYAYWVHADVPTFVAGALSGVIASFAATPPDVLKTRILSQDKWSKQRKQQPQPAAVQAQVMVLASSSIGSDSTLTMMPSFSNSNSTILLEAMLPAPSVVGHHEFTNQEHYNNDERNPLIVARTIIEREGAGVLLSGVSERCLGAIPRFGTTMALHDVLEQAVAQQGWLSHAITQL